MKRTVVWILFGLAACNSGSSTSCSADSSASKASAEGGGASGGGGTEDALAGSDGSGNGSSGGASSSGAPVPRTGNGKTDQGCVTHADCAAGYFCYLGATMPTTVCGGPSGSCATCQGGTCPATFVCSCLLSTLCSTNSPCTDNGKVIVCQQQPQGM